MRVSTCCCGCSLQTGCLIIAIWGLIFGSINFYSVMIENGGKWYIIQSILSIIAAVFLLWGTL